MLSPRWSKVLRDLWGNKTRTTLIVLSIAVGVFAIGMISGAQVALSRDLTNAYLAVEPAAASLTAQPFDEELVDVVRGMKEVREAEARRSLGLRVKVGPEEWKTLVVYALPDYSDIRINKIRPVSGDWPPPDKEMLLERVSTEFLGLREGDVAVVEMPGGKLRKVRVAGVVHDLSQYPSFFSGQGYAYVTSETLEWLGSGGGYNELSILVAENAMDKAHVQRVANSVRDKVEKSGRVVYFAWVPDPGKHPVDSAFQAILLLLGILGMLSLLLSGFLVVNTISALMTQQVRQIGIMKAVGAHANQITGMYLGLVLAFSVLALLVGVPLGSLAAMVVSNYVAALVNFDLINFSLPPHVFALQAAVGLAVPLLAALYPIIVGTRITVREAMSTYGLAQGSAKRGVVEMALERISGLSRPMLLSLRNTFRRKGRLALTLATLVLGGAIFISVFSARDSAYLTLEDALRYYNFDVVIDFERPYGTGQIRSEATTVPGVVQTETPVASMARRVRPDGNDGAQLVVFALPATTSLIQPTVVEGRWLVNEDENGIVINTDVLRLEPDIKLGDSIVLTLDGHDTTWRVVGIVRGVMTGSTGYANYPYFSRLVHSMNRSGSAWVLTEMHDAASQASVAAALEKQYERAGMRVASTETISNIRARIVPQFDMIVVFLLTMAVLLAIVGGLGLMGTMSLNVLERTKEIGVMRAIGANDGSVRSIFLIEGTLIGVLSWLIAAVLAVPLSRLLSDSLGMALMSAPLSPAFSLSGIVIWFVVVVILAGMASALPARNATRVSVRDVLTYE